MLEESQLSIFKVDKFINLDFFRQSKKNINLLNVLREAICFNQAELAQYNFSLSQAHKKLKDESRQEPSNREKLKQLYDELINCANKQLTSISRRNFEFLLQCFQDRKSVNPRVCLKLIDTDYIITAFRDKRTAFEEKDYKREVNTAFKRICLGERAYHCPNIPRDAKNKRYINARLVSEKVEAYRESGWSSNILKFFGHNIHSNWQDCWERISQDQTRPDLTYPPLETCYKSTFVVPLSLRKSDLEDQFIEHFDVNMDEVSERLILGFLCLDHQDINFFIEEIDEPLIYIFADILSLYLILRMTFTDYSTTFQKVKYMLQRE